MSEEWPSNTYNTIFSYMSPGPHNPLWGYWRKFSLLEMIWRWIRGFPTKEYIPGLVDKMPDTGKTEWLEAP